MSLDSDTRKILRMREKWRRLVRLDERILRQRKLIVDLKARELGTEFEEEDLAALSCDLDALFAKLQRSLTRAHAARSDIFSSWIHIG